MRPLWIVLGYQEMTKWVDKIHTFIRHPFLCKYSTLMALWTLLGLIAWLTKYFPGKYNNFTIFKQSFWHALNELPLYIPYPEEYHDIFHYGPTFSLLVAPFALTPLWFGLFAWLVGQALFLYWAIRMLPIAKRKHIFIYWFCAHELLTALFMSQFNISVTALLILSYVFIEKEKDGWAALMIIIGVLTKLYGIAGLAFFFFSRHKLKFSLSCFGWAILLVAAPMILTGPDYILSQYTAWFADIAHKNAENLFAVMQNISFLGIVRKISGVATYSDLYLILGGLALFALPYLRIGQYKYPAFRLTILASVLLFIVLFSTGSESSTYIIALTGVAIWYTVAPWKRSKWDIGLMVFAFILTSMSPSDLFPKYLRVHYVYPYALKALPCMLIWLKLTYEMCTQNYHNKKEVTA